jgi:predicted lipid-binding transport protein (Tim44 family)
MRPTAVVPTNRSLLGVAAGLAVALAAAGCGDGRSSPATAAPTSVVAPAPLTSATTPPAPAPPSASSAPSTAPSSAPSSAESTAPAPKPGVHFATPEAAMRYLTAAYNRNDLPALKKVTNPPARAALLEMRQEATNLQLTGCSLQPRGDYVCSFRHDFPEHRHRAGHGQATFLAAPADKPGWYMTVLLDCD